MTTAGNPCFVYTYPTRDRGPTSVEGAAYCRRDGVFGPGIVPLRPQNLGGISNFASRYVVATGVDAASSSYFAYLGPLGSRIYSPATTLIEYAGSQAIAKRALGLDAGVFALATDPDLTVYDPVAALASADDATRREGARVVAANLRALAVAAGITAVQQGRYRPFDSLQPNFQAAGDFIASRNAFLFDNATMTDLLAASTTPGRYRADVLSAAAHLINAYASAIGVQVQDQAAAARFTLGLTGYLRVELGRLMETNSAAAAAAAMAVTNQSILDATAVYLNAIPIAGTGFFFPGPDFLVGTAATPLTVSADSTGDPGNLGSLTRNDINANGPTGSIGFFGASSTVLSVSVPAANATAISATLAGGVVTVTPLNGFVGTSYFDYRVRHPEGEEGTARVYVSFR